MFRQKLKNTISLSLENFGLKKTHQKQQKLNAARKQQICLQKNLPIFIRTLSV